MPRLYMVRHGKAAAGFGESMDPGLDVVGKAQANEVAMKLRSLGPLGIMTSPLARARETAAPLADIWNCEPVVEPAIAEIPSPTESLQDRVVWLRQLMAGSWQSATPALAAWREAAISALLAQREDKVIFSHYIAINVAVGFAERDGRVVVFSPDNCSVTIFDVHDGRLHLVERGHEAALTKVN